MIRHWMARAGLLFATAALIAPLYAGEAAAQGAPATYPARPIRVIVPFPAGGPSDVGMRVIAQKMTDNWGQQVLVDNRPGANTIIGAEAVAKSSADGYTLLFAIDSTLTMNQHLYAKIPYDPVRDFAPVSLTLWSPLIVVTDAQTGPGSIKDLIQRARAAPGKLSYGAGTITTQLAGEQFKRMSGLDIVMVPYKSTPDAQVDVIAGRVPIWFTTATAAMPQWSAGRAPAARAT